LTETIKLSDLQPDNHNANKGTERGRLLLEKSLHQYGAGRSILLDKHGRIIAGNKTAQTAGEIGIDDVIVVRTKGDKLVAVLREDLDLSDDESGARMLAYADNRVGQADLEWDAEALLADMTAGFNLDEFWFEDELKDIFADVPGYGNGAGEPGDAEPQTNRAEELRQEWGVKPGQLWRLPSRTPGQEHRLICGDCTDTAVVERVMGGEVADLAHADPPYGMGKEKDGIANDNLYGPKLDAFQMRWWNAQRPFLADNGSAYIWGNAEDLWRLWYKGVLKDGEWVGLQDSERLTFRSEIAWDKREENPTMLVSGVPLESRRMYHPTERALFFMLGEQGFNNNADNYWDGWEPIRAQLKADCDRMGWGAKDIERICGVGMYGHWFTKSQWTFIPEEHYKKLQAAAREHDAFKREHDELKREHDELKREHDELKRDFYATRAYFDNTHDNMTDVWEFQRVTGDERHGHATPKPVVMMERAIKSSCPQSGIVYVPFGGTAPELIAAENTGRQARLVELDAGYCAIILQRYYDAFGITPELMTDETAVPHPTEATA
jgi:DNA modification methylase